MFPLYCLRSWYNVFSERLTIHCIPSWTIQYFFRFSGLKPNLTKCEVAVIGALKGVQVAICGMNCIDLCNEVIKILGTYFSRNNTMKEESNFFKVVSNVQTVLKLWRFRNLTLEGRIIVFKSLAISKIVSQALIETVPSHTIKTLERI